MFVIFFLTPPVYMLITSLKTSAEISAGTAPWWVFDPTLENYVEILDFGDLPDVLPQLGGGLACWWSPSPCW